jgi:hypothetical protein
MDMRNDAEVRIPAVNSVQLLNPHESGWQECLMLVGHDFFHTAGYHDLSQVNDGGEAWLAVYGNAERFVAWPYLLREIDDLGNRTRGLYDITSAYGFTGPLTYNCTDDDDFLARAWAALINTWRSQGGIRIFTRFHPIWANTKWIMSNCMLSSVQGVEGGPCAQGHTVAIDLTRSSIEVWNGYKSQLRTALRRCQREGLMTTPDPGWANLDEFISLYYRTMERNHAASFYFFTTEYFHRLQEALGPHGSLMITRHWNDVVAAALLIEYGGIVNVHLLANNERFSYLSPSKLTIHEAAVWAKSRGNRFLMIGGGRGARDDDPLFRFKSMFSQTTLPFYTGRWILDRDAYEFVAGEWRKQAGRDQENLSKDGQLGVRR